MISGDNPTISAFCSGKIPAMIFSGDIPTILPTAWAVVGLSPEVLHALRNRGISVWMISGDNPTTAHAVGKIVGISPNRMSRRWIVSRNHPYGNSSVAKSMQDLFGLWAYRISHISVWMISGDNPTTAHAVGKIVGISPENIIAGILVFWRYRIFSAFCSGKIPAMIFSGDIPTILPTAWAGMISGDNPTTAHAVGKIVGISPENIIAGILPEQKASGDIPTILPTAWAVVGLSPEIIHTEIPLLRRACTQRPKRSCMLFATEEFPYGWFRETIQRRLMRLVKYQPQPAS
jgi:soluble P-type ATPase